MINTTMEYKLIKRYPSLPKGWNIGTVVDLSEFNGEFIYESRHHTVRKYEVRNNPDFWEKLGKDYEILSFKDPESGRMISIDEKQKPPCIYKFNSNTWMNEKECLNNDLDIYSIRRLTDNTVFTIGDKCKLINKSTITIHRIKLIERLKSIHLFSKKGLNVDLMDTEEEGPILTTIDGVEIYEGDPCHSVVNWNPFEHVFRNTTPRSFIQVDTRKYFSTKEKAKEWIEYNKPRYSRKDLHDILENIKEEKDGI